LTKNIGTDYANATSLRVERTFLSEKTELHPPTEAEQLLFYVTRKKQVLGTADFLERLTGNYEDLWEKFGSESCFETFEEYKSFLMRE
jgi:hypothetical protein